MEEFLLPGCQLLGFVHSVEDVAFIANELRFGNGGEVVRPGQNAFCNGATSFEDEGEVVEGEGLAADVCEFAGGFEGVVEADEDVGDVDEDVDAVGEIWVLVQGWVDEGDGAQVGEVGGEGLGEFGEERGFLGGGLSEGIGG